MSSRFAQGLPSRHTPGVCFPIRISPPLDPTNLPLTLNARFFIQWAQPEETIQLDVHRATLVKDPDQLHWDADDRVDGNGIVLDLYYSDPDLELTVDFYHARPDWPELHQSWHELAPETFFPYYLALEKIFQEHTYCTIWGYITA